MTNSRNLATLSRTCKFNSTS